MYQVQRIYAEQDMIDVQLPVTIISQPNHSRINMMPINNKKIEVNTEVLQTASLTVCKLSGYERLYYVAILTNIPPGSITSSIRLGHQNVEILHGKCLTILMIGGDGMILEHYYLQGVINQKIILRSHQGRLYVGGTFDNGFLLRQSDAFIQFTVCPRVGSTAFVVCIDSENNHAWTCQMVPSVFSIMSDIQLDEIGDVYLTGTYAAQEPDQVSLRAITSNTGSQADIFLMNGGAGIMTFLAMINRGGDPVWITSIRPIPSTVSSTVSSEAIQVKGKIITLVGYYDCGSLRFYQVPNGSVLSDLELTTTRTEIFIAKYTTQGAPLLVRKIGGDLIDRSGRKNILGLAVGKKDQIFVSGSCGEYLHLDGVELIPPLTTRIPRISWVVKLNALGFLKWTIWITGIIDSIYFELNVLRVIGGNFPDQATITFFDSQLRRKQTIAYSEAQNTMRYLTEYRSDGQYIRTCKQTSTGKIQKSQIASLPMLGNKYSQITLSSTIANSLEFSSNYDIFSSNGQIACSNILTSQTVIFLTSLSLVSQTIDLPSPLCGVCFMNKTIILESVNSNQGNTGTHTIIQPDHVILFEDGYPIDHLCLNEPVTLELFWNKTAWHLVGRR
jgi:hypothetical protein